LKEIKNCKYNQFVN